MQCIWFTEPTLERVNRITTGTLLGSLGILITEIGPDFLCGTMPVDERTRQPVGVLHGGASVALAETLGSLGAYLTVDPERFHCLGIEINANHLKAVYQGDTVTGTSRPLHQGRTTQVWEIHMHNSKGELCCVSRHTVMVVPRAQVEKP